MQSKKTERIKEIADQAARKLSGPLGFGFYDLQTGESCYRNGEKLFPTASIFKIFVLAELYRLRNEGKLSLEDRYPLKGSMKVPGSGILFQMSEGTDYSLYDYAFLMMTLSDNTAADFLYEYVGRANIRDHVLKPMGLQNTKVELSCAELFQYYCNIDPALPVEQQMHAYLTGDFRNNDYYFCTQENNDVTTPQDLSTYYTTMYEGKWCSRQTSSDLLDLMKKCQTNSRIPKKLPVGTQVAHKTGTFDRLVCDSGIVYTKKGAYILSLLYNGNLASPDEYLRNQGGSYGEAVLAEISKEVFDIFTDSSKK